VRPIPQVLGSAAALLVLSGCSAGATVGASGTAPRAVTRLHGTGVTAGPAPSQVRAERPLGLGLPSGARLPVEVATTDSTGALALPEDVDHASWWTGSSKLGDPYGAIVLAAHVDSFAEGIGPIAEILDSRRGDVLRVNGRRLVRQFEVVSTSFVRRTDLAGQASLLSVSGDRRLVLITCGGPYGAAWGGYRDNFILVATERSTP
jgi:hypothetical protein